nr:T9SS type A sorting domain-containing protein [Flavobacteriaceae bacterium]
LGNKYYQASYSAGMRVLDITDIANGTMTELGYFDVHSFNNNPGFNGAWSVYPYFESGNIVISSLGSQGGFYLVKETSLSVTDNDTDFGITVSPNPVKNRLILQNSTGIEITSMQLFDVTGRLIQNYEGGISDEIHIPTTTSNFLILQINTESGTISKKLMVSP